MITNQETKIIALVGLSGAGKSEATDYIAEKGYPKIYFGGILYKAMEEAGIEITPESQQIFREEIREREGKDFVVKRAIAQAHDLINSGQKHIILDGLYTWTEYRILKREFPGEMIVVAVVAPKRLRHRRLITRPVRPFTQEEADKRDWSEIENLEKGGPIAIADHYIMNDSDLENLHRQIDQILEEIEFII